MDYNYDYNFDITSDSLSGGAIAAISGIFIFIMLVSLVVGIIMLISMFKIYKKAGKKGWESLIPIYNIIVLLEITKLPTWYIVLFFIPFVNFIVMIITYLNLAKVFGKDSGFGVLLLFAPVIGIPILAFGKSKYVDDIQLNVSEPTDLNNQTDVVEPVNISEPIVSIEEVKQENELTTKDCPQCNNKVSEDSEFCSTCGFKF